MAWKMSTDLSRPLVASMGQHDPLDGLITCAQLGTTAALLSNGVQGPDLQRAISDFVAMIEHIDLRTEDPLGLGGLLADGYRVAQLMVRGVFADGVLLKRLLAAAQEGLVHYSRHGDWQQPASRRLAFRELGLAAGLAAIERLQKDMDWGHRRAFGSDELRAWVHALGSYIGLRDVIVSAWLAPEHQRVYTWSEHRDINEVMLATSLVPDGFLIIAARGET